MNNTIYFTIDGKTIECIVSDSCICIRDSHCVKLDNTKRYILEQLLIMVPDFKETRTVDDMFYEWKTHNILYNWGVAKSHTVDVDFEAHQNGFLKFLYKLFAKVFKEWLVKL